MARIARPREGGAMLEVMFAILLLAIVGQAWILLLAQQDRVVRHARHHEDVVRACGARLETLAAMSSDSLRAMTGASRLGECDVVITPRSEQLVRVEMRDTSTHGVLLSTSLYVPSSPRDGE